MVPPPSQTGRMATCTSGPRSISTSASFPVSASLQACLNQKNISLAASARTRLGIVDFASAQAAGSLVKLNKSDNWLRQCQGVALPILPPSTIESRTYYLESLPLFLGPSTKAGKTALKLEPFTAHWNASADGIQRSYFTSTTLWVRRLRRQA